MGYVRTVVGDIGGGNEVKAVSSALETKYGLSVKWSADPKGKAGVALLQPAGIPFETCGPQDGDNPLAIVVGTSATAVDLQIAWTKYGRENGIKVYWIEDFWGTGSRPNTRMVSPDHMLVMDSIAEKIAISFRTDLQVRALGKPSYAKLPAMIEKKDEIRKAIRAAKGIGENEFLVKWMFCGDPAERSWEQLEIFCRYGATALKKYGVKIFPRFHAKHPDKDKLWEEFRTFGLEVADLRDTNMQESILASDLVFGDWRSSDSIVAVLAEIPCATVLYPDDKKLRLDAGYPDGVPPLLMEDRFWAVGWPDDMITVVAETKFAMEGMRGALKRRAESFKVLLSPGSAERMAQKIVNTM